MSTRVPRPWAGIAAIVLIGLAATGCRSPFAASESGSRARPFCDAVVAFNDSYQAAEARAADADWTPASVKLAYTEWLRLEQELLEVVPPQIADAQRTLVEGYDEVMASLEGVQWQLGRADQQIFDYSQAELDALAELNDYLTSQCAVPYFTQLGFEAEDARCLAEELNAAARSLYTDVARQTVEAALVSCGLPPARADLWDY